MELTQRSSRFGVRQFVAALQNRVYRPILAAFTLTVLSVGCVSSGSAQNAQPAPVPPPAAGQAQQPLTVSKADIPHTILITGELRAARSRDLIVPRISSGFASTVTYLPLEGTLVKPGDRLLEFDGSSLLTSKTEGERKLDEAKLKIDKTKADLEAQRADLLNEVSQAEGKLKIAEVYGKISKDILAGTDYQKYQLDLAQAKLGLDKAKSKLASHEGSIPAQLALVELDKSEAELDLKKSIADLALLQVNAPQEGIVIYGDNWQNNRKIQVGDSLFPGMPVLSLPDLSSMQVLGHVYDTELRYLSGGMVCDFHLDAVPGKSWRGKIEALTSVASRKGFATQHKVFRAVIQPDSIDQELMKPGMTVRVEVPVVLASNVVAIPREYVGLDPQGRYFIKKGTDNATAKVQIVTVGVFNSRLVQILSGLEAGERILPPRPPVEGNP